jgi:hypothetical protein
VDADRLSAYRIGSLLPLVSEFPLSLPGYFYQEISARDYLLAGGNYALPLDPHRHWNLCANGSTAWFDGISGVARLPGLPLQDHWASGVGGGILYRSSSLKVILGYAYGIDAIRDNGRGASSVGILLQLDLEKAHAEMFSPTEPSRWRGFEKVFGGFGD